MRVEYSKEFNQWHDCCGQTQPVVIPKYSPWLIFSIMLRSRVMATGMWWQWNVSGNVHNACRTCQPQSAKWMLKVSAKLRTMNLIAELDTRLAELSILNINKLTQYCQSCSFSRGIPGSDNQQLYLLMAVKRFSLQLILWSIKSFYSPNDTLNLKSLINSLILISLHDFSPHVEICFSWEKLNRTVVKSTHQIAGQILMASSNRSTW